MPIVSFPPDFVFCLNRWKKAMPFIHIKSLPFEKPVEMKAVFEGYAVGDQRGFLS
jgi:hypothetical protein